MEIILPAAALCLLTACIILIMKLLHLKRELRRFSEELEKRKDICYSQPVKVTTFDKDIVRLAVKLNEHSDIQRKLCTEYEQSKKQLSNVISGISHDFRTPLTAALGYMQMIEKSGELSEKQLGYLNTAIEKNKYLSELSDEFFEITKAENHAELVYENINISNLLTEAVLEQHEWIQKRGITTDINIQDGIILNTDAHCLLRIVSNLFSNSEKYSVSRFAVSLTSADGKVTLRVSNDLADTANTDISRVFEPFYRLHSRTSSGSGLGLYIVKTLADKLGMSISASIENTDDFVILCVANINL